MIQIQLRRGTSSQWTTANPILALAEMGIETDSKKFKIGDGLTAWNSLAYGGIQGPQGVQGVKGDKGDQGDPGVDGAQGLTGPQGPQGIQGPAGAQGLQGAQGAKGDKGDTGNTGPQGPQGLQGAQGAKGDTGAQGPQGIAGPNQVTTSTSTTLNAILKGNGTNVAAAIAGTDFVAPVAGKQLSTEDYTTAEKSKLAGIASGATANDTDSNLKNRANHTGTQAPSTIATDSSNRFVTDAEKSTWNGKQDALVSATNIKTINGTSILGSGDLSVGGSSTWGAITGTLSSQTDLQSALNAKQDSLGFTPENITNKATNLNSPSNTTYPSTQAVINRINAEDAAYFGGGTDGDVTITGPVTLVRDMFYNNLTISGAGTINAAGFRIFVAGTLNVSGAVSTGKIQRNGNAGANSSGQAGAGGAGGFGAASMGGSGGAQSGAAGGAAGLAGGNAISNAGTVNCMGGDPGDSGDGGAGASAAGGVGAAPTLLNATNLVINNRFSDFFFRGTGIVSGGIGGQGGSGGGGGTGVGGGGGGGGGGAGIVWVSACTIDLSAATGPIICALGGNAGNGHNIPSNGGGGGGGGAGGGGGYCFFAYKNLVGSLANFIDVSGGRGGNGGNGNSPGLGGEGGGSGAGGAATIINLQTGVVTQLARGTSNPKVAASGSTGGTGATAPVHQLGI